MVELALLVAALMAVAAGSYLLTALTIRLVASRLRAPAILMSGFILPLCLFVLAFGLFHRERSEYPKSDAPIVVLSGTLIGALMATPISLTAAWAAVYRYKAQRQTNRE
ncbi:hypothetical protein ACSBM8_18650 [Sphingomonas sp. ASY06-1R]|uniref:hypothetical protein n=1 Tax=Sphingomonas sp. ASY06-1R TaxID=3445771 RepID=UPI003FA1B96E